MSHVLNSLGQPVGRPLPDWRPPLAPGREPMAGSFCRLEPLDPALHADLANRGRLVEANKQQKILRRELAAAEERWLEATGELESAASTSLL